MTFQSFNDVMDFAINQEVKAAKFYNILADYVEQQEMADVLISLSLQELEHKAKLEAIKARKIAIDMEEVGDLYISSHVKDVEYNAKMDYVELLIIGMKKEESARRLYTDLAKAAQTRQLRDIFIKLANEETQHKMRFELEYDLLTF